MITPVFAIGEDGHVDAIHELPFRRYGSIHLGGERGILPHQVVVLLPGFERRITGDVQGTGLSRHGIEGYVVALLLGAGGD